MFMGNTFECKVISTRQMIFNRFNFFKKSCFHDAYGCNVFKCFGGFFV